MSAFDLQPTFLSVSELNALVRNTLEERLPFVRVRGEISNCRPASSGHLYFSLKDADALVGCVMFRNRLNGVVFEPSDGMEVDVTGTLSVYEKRGTYQVVCETMTQVGSGSILLLLEERKRRLAAEGLFDAERKKPLPLLPKRIAVVTSPTGAAIRDILHVLGRRAAGIDVVVVPAPVQGDDAAKKLALQLERADRLGLGDVIILSRGGGSLEDLLPFSEEVLVRAVAACKTPVISAVGHEIDNALCDYAADLRAPTPSAAAELVAGSREELRTRVLSTGRFIARTFAGRLREVRSTLKPFRSDSLQQSFRAYLQPHFLRLDDAKEDLADGMARLVADFRKRLESGRLELEACSPWDVLARGYAVVETVDGKIVRSSESLHVQEEVRLRFHEGSADASIVKTRTNQPERKGTSHVV